MITAENKELKIRLHSMEQQAQLRDGILLVCLCYYFMGACRSLLEMEWWNCYISMRLQIPRAFSSLTFLS